VDLQRGPPSSFPSPADSSNVKSHPIRSNHLYFTAITMFFLRQHISVRSPVPSLALLLPIEFFSTAPPVFLPQLLFFPFSHQHRLPPSVPIADPLSAPIATFLPLPWSSYPGTAPLLSSSVYSHRQTADPAGRAWWRGMCVDGWAGAVGRAWLRWVAWRAEVRTWLTAETAIRGRRGGVRTVVETNSGERGGRSRAARCRCRERGGE
jgi:hypothetical protein